MKLETASNGFILKVNAVSGPTIEWNASEDEVTILLPTLDKDGRLDPIAGDLRYTQGAMQTGV